MNRSRRSARSLGIASCLATVCLLESDALAHPASTTEIALTIRDAGLLEVAVTIDHEALRAKVSALQRPLADLVEVRCDGARVPLTVIACEAQGCESDSGVVRLAGVMPRGASAVTIGSSLVYGSYPVTIRRASTGDPVVQWLQGPETSTPYALHARDAHGRGGDILRYLSLGFTHILPHGFDHMLFVLGLFLLSRRMGSLIAQVSAFTLAHSITLGLSLYGMVSLPAAVIDPLIALSIAYVAIENLVTTDLKPLRLAFVFAFGLLHGLGFAGALAGLDLPRPEFFTTLVTFNVGVELGQLAVIAAAALLVRAVAVPAAQYRQRIVWPASAAIALTAVFWTIERLV